MDNFATSTGGLQTDWIFHTEEINVHIQEK